jgi:quercetin dioxygenase-like cupin family protein
VVISGKEAVMRRAAVTLAVGMAAGLAVGVLGTRLLTAQSEGIKRTMLFKTDLAGIEGLEAVIGLAEVAPGVAAGRHYHDGDELGYVLEGTAVLEVAGRAPIALRAGDTYHIEAKHVHDAKNAGTTPAKVLAIWIVEKGKPLVTPSP